MYFNNMCSKYRISFVLLRVFNNVIYYNSAILIKHDISLKNTV